MSPRADFTVIRSVEVSFTENRLYPDMEAALNRSYATVLPDHGRLFKDPETMTELKAANDLIILILQIINEEIILEHAQETDDIEIIKQIMSRATIKVVVPGGNYKPRFLCHGAIHTALEHARTKKLPSIGLEIDTSVFYLKTVDHVTYHDWSVFTTDSTLAVFPISSPDPVTPATPVATPPTIDIAAITAAVTIAMAQLRTTETPPSPSPPTLPSADIASPTVNDELYSPSQFPDDVRERYKAKRNNKLILGKTVSTPYVNENYYYRAQPGVYVLGDGTLFIHRTLDEKGATRNPPKCKDNTYSGIRRWYALFASYLANFGIYIHPLWCFRANHGGKWGFIYGTSTGCDLPDTMESYLLAANPILYRILLNDMFEKDSKLQAIVDACPNDGYHALNSIMVMVHPAFQSQPATLITDYPHQGASTLHQFFNTWTDYTQLRAYILDIESSLDNPNELDTFLSRCNFSDFLNRVTYSERTDPKTAHLYLGAQLPSTLQTHLSRPDSPLKLQKKPSHHFSPQKATLRIQDTDDNAFVP